MAKAKTVVGLDVHATKVVAAVLGVETGRLSRFQTGGDALGAAGFCAGLPRPVRVAMRRDRPGWACPRARPPWRGVCGRGSVEDSACVGGSGQDRSIFWCGCCWGGCTRSGCPEEEALRDLVRACQQCGLVRCPFGTVSPSSCCVTGSALMTAERGLTIIAGAGSCFAGRAGGGDDSARPPRGADDSAGLLRAIDALCHRRDALEREIVSLVPASPWAVQVGRLRCLRGIDTLTAVGLCSEIGDFERFAKAEQLLTYLLVRREHHRATAAAGVDHQGRIRACPPAADRSPAWHYRPRPRIGKALPTARPASHRKRGDLLVSPTPTAPHLDPPASPGSKRRTIIPVARRPRARRILLGPRQRRLTPPGHAPRGLQAGRPLVLRESIRDLAMSVMKEASVGGTFRRILRRSELRRRPVFMLHAGLDLSRRRLDYCLLDEAGERVEIGGRAA